MSERLKNQMILDANLAVCANLKVELRDLLNKRCRKPHVVTARQIVYYLLARHGFTISDICSAFGQSENRVMKSIDCIRQGLQLEDVRLFFMACMSEKEFLKRINTKRETK